MTDLIERLRLGDGTSPDHLLLLEAADALEKSWHCSTQHLMALVERVVAEEREACAKVCEDSVEYAGDELARQIRARGKA